MRITKLEHAALRVEDAGETLLIDPGKFMLPLSDLGSLVAIVITHEHADHWTPEQLDRILEKAPRTPIYAPASVAAKATSYEITAMAPGEKATVGGFELEFFGGLHEVIHSSIPVVQNLGVLVNGELYYPGDSYAVPEGVAVGTLAAPAGAPWLRIGDAMDFVLAVAPRRCFATHDMPLSQIGLTMHRARLQWATEQGGGTYTTLEVGESLNV